jgi:ABC-type sugar transport system permease subunit
MTPHAAIEATDVRAAPRRHSRRRLGTSTLGWLYVTPALLLLAGIYAYPVYELFRLSTEQSLGSLTENVGFLNFELVLDDPRFGTAVTNTLKLLLCVPLMTAAGLFLAILLFEQQRWRRLAQFLLMIPFFTSIAVTGIAFGNILTKSGPFNELLSSLGLGALQQDWLADPSIALLTIGAVIVWQQSAFAVVIFYARLLSVPVTLYEAATIDGAGWGRRHWHITLPQLRASLGFYVTYAAITIIAWVFPYVFIMTRGGPGSATLTTDLYVYNNAFGGAQTNLAAAAAVLVLIGTAALAIAVAGARRAWKVAR